MIVGADAVHSVRKILRGLTLVFGVLAGGTILWRLKNEPAMSPGQQFQNLSDYGPVTDFTLRERNGTTVGLANLAGRVWVADFIFTRCSGPCPRISSEMAKLQKEFASEPSVRFVSFTVDPDYDTPRVLSGYADRFGADRERWHFLTGKIDDVRKLLANSFHVTIANDPRQAVGQNMSHSLSFVLVDSRRRIRGYYLGTDKEALSHLRQDLRRLL